MYKLYHIIFSFILLSSVIYALPPNKNGIDELNLALTYFIDDKPDEGIEGLRIASEKGSRIAVMLLFVKGLEAPKVFLNYEEPLTSLQKVEQHFWLGDYDRISYSDVKTAETDEIYDEIWIYAAVSWFLKEPGLYWEYLDEIGADLYMGHTKYYRPDLRIEHAIVLYKRGPCFFSYEKMLSSLKDPDYKKTAELLRIVLSEKSF